VAGLAGALTSRNHLRPVFGLRQLAFDAQNLSLPASLICLFSLDQVRWPCAAMAGLSEGDVDDAGAAST
jgi:hypothetical protein